MGTVSRMREDWYRLLGSVHYLGYHTQPAMSYTLDEAVPFSLVTSNSAEAKTAQELLKNGGSMQAAIWVIEGARKSYEWTLSGTGQEFGRAICLNPQPWFAAFRDDNGNFGFGLRVLRDRDVRDAFTELARPFFTEN